MHVFYLENFCACCSDYITLLTLGSIASEVPIAHVLLAKSKQNGEPELALNFFSTL